MQIPFFLILYVIFVDGSYFSIILKYILDEFQTKETILAEKYYFNVFRKNKKTIKNNTSHK